MARKNKALNPRQVDNLADGFWADGERLFLRVADGGRRRSWVWRAVKDGKVTSMGLGRAGQGGVSLADARAKAKKHNEDLDEGDNPLERRREREREEKARKTLREAAEAFIKEKDRKWGASSRAIWRRFVDRDIGVIGDAPVDTLGREDIKRAVHALGQMTGKGNRKRKPGVPAERMLQQRVSAVLEYACENGWRPENSRCRWSMVAEHVNDGAERHHPALMPPEKHDDHDAALIVETIKRLRASTSASALCLEFAALTALRVGEAADSKFGYVNPKTATMTLSAGDMKMRRKHVIPLSRRAMEIIAECEKHKVSDYLFPGHRDGSAISRTTVYDQCNRVTGGRASPHGWRATFRSWCSTTGVDFEVAEACLAHAKSKIVAAYDRADMIDRRRVTMERWAQFLSGEDAETDNVVPFGKRA